MLVNTWTIRDAVLRDMTGKVTLVTSKCDLMNERRMWIYHLWIQKYGLNTTNRRCETKAYPHF